MGHTFKNQLSLGKPIPWQFKYRHGGVLRQKRRGRFARPLSTRAPIHLVFKANKISLKKGLRSPLGFAITQRILRKYSRRFLVKIEQVAICQDHIHLLVRLSRRSLGQHFFRVVAGQIAQEFIKTGMLKTATNTPGDGVAKKQNAEKAKTRPLWKYRPFTRVIQGWKAYQVARNYIQLNEKEASGQIKYQPKRLKGLSSAEWELLWTD